MESFYTLAEGQSLKPHQNKFFLHCVTESRSFLIQYMARKPASQLHQKARVVFSQLETSKITCIAFRKSTGVYYGGRRYGKVLRIVTGTSIDDVLMENNQTKEDSQSFGWVGHFS